MAADLTARWQQRRRLTMKKDILPCQATLSSLQRLPMALGVTGSLRSPLLSLSRACRPNSLPLPQLPCHLIAIIQVWQAKTQNTWCTCLFGCLSVILDPSAVPILTVLNPTNWNLQQQRDQQSQLLSMTCISKPSTFSRREFLLQRKLSF